MSGGYFDHQQYVLSDIADQIDEIILKNNSKELNEFGDPEGRGYTEETIEEFVAAVRILREAYVYIQRVDWLLSGDDGEEEFHKRLEQDLADFWNSKPFHLTFKYFIE